MFEKQHGLNGEAWGGGSFLRVRATAATAVRAFSEKYPREKYSLGIIFRNGVRDGRRGSFYAWRATAVGEELPPRHRAAFTAFVNVGDV